MVHSIGALLPLLSSTIGRGTAAAILIATLQLPAAAQSCPEPPAPVVDLNLPRFYADDEGSKVDPELAKEHKLAVEPLNTFLRQVVADADKAARRSDPQIAACPLMWLDVWARGNAFLGSMATKQGEYERKWDLGGIALAYLKLRPHANAAQRQSIERWLERFAEKAKAFQLDPARKRNNHLYWLGLGLAATAMATDNGTYWEEARRIMQEAAGHISANGSLPLELQRGSRALHYHAFAVTPLVAMAEMAARRGEDWYAFSGGALHRLVSLTAAGLGDPQIFDELARITQERPAGRGAGWLGLYAARYRDRLPKQLPDVPPKHRWLGGDARLSIEAVPRPGRA